MKRTIFLNSGHSLFDPGSVTVYAKESDLNQSVRNALIPELEKQGFKVEKVPDYLDLKDSIAWVNQRAKDINDGLALSVHQNCCGGVGAETYYYKTSSKSKEIATKLVNIYCQEKGMMNRGAKSSTDTRFGRLGWIEDTNSWAVLIECGFLDNINDVTKVKDYSSTAKAICKGVNAIFGIEYKESNLSLPDNKPSNNKRIRVLAQEIINLT